MVRSKEFMGTRRAALGAILCAAALALGACGGGPAPQAEAGAPQRQEARVYLLMGQSNMVGYGADPSQVPAADAAPAGSTIFVDGAWIPLVAGGRYQASGVGPELGLAEELGPAALVKVAVNGTGLATDWAPGSALRERAIAQALAALGSRPSRLAGIAWAQGETDAHDPASAAAYRDNLRGFVGELRARLGAPDLPFVAARVAPPLPDFAWRDQVRAAQMDPGLSAYAWVDCDDLPLSDGLHFTAAGELTLGHRLGQALRALGAGG